MIQEHVFIYPPIKSSVTTLQLFVSKFLPASIVNSFEVELLATEIRGVIVIVENDNKSAIIVPMIYSFKLFKNLFKTISYLANNI